MAEVSRASRLRRTARALVGFADSLLHVHAHVVFSRSRLVGALLLLAAATSPVGLAHGLLAVGVAAATMRLLGLDGRSLREGPYGYNALFVGMFVANTFATGRLSVGLAVIAAVVCVAVTAALSSLFARAALPVLSVPFVLVSWALLGAAPLAGASPAVHALPLFDPAMPEPLSTVLRGLGALFFAPEETAGALVLGALLLHSRIATTLAAIATCLGLGVARSLGVAGPSLETPLVLNGALTAIALGGIWFVPSASSYALAGCGAVISGAVLLGLSGPLDRMGLPPLILPFSVSLGLVLLATRQRTRDESPKAVDFTPGSPEENLDYHQCKLARFDSLRVDSLRLPFRGTWTCTQGEDGAHTHQGAWRHGFDFEVAGADGRLFQGEGASVDDHHCFRLPVLAAADGIVAKVVNDVADNAVGRLDLAKNWGNVVVVYHAPGVYSLVAHLAKGSAKVREGQHVKRGEVLGACGSSGRSPRPHLHFQLQATAELGAPTIPCRFTDTVTVTDHPGDAGADATEECVSRSLVPTLHQRLRNLEPDAELAACFAFEPGAVLVVSGDQGGPLEHLEHEVDLLGNLVLRSRELGAKLYMSRSGEGFTALEVTGSRRSALHVLRAALARVPFDADPRLAWTDYLPARWAAWPLARLLRDFIAPFAPSPGVEMVYRTRRERGLVVVLGASRATRRGAPAVRTSATLSPTHGLLGLELETRGRRLSFLRVLAGHDPSPEPDERPRAGAPAPSPRAPSNSVSLAPLERTSRPVQELHFHSVRQLRTQGDTP